MDQEVLNQQVIDRINLLFSDKGIRLKKIAELMKIKEQRLKHLKGGNVKAKIHELEILNDILNNLDTISKEDYESLAVLNAKTMLEKDKIEKIIQSTDKELSEIEKGLKEGKLTEKDIDQMISKIRGNLSIK